MSGVLLTAGYDRAWHSVYIAERLRRLGHGPKLILLAYPVSPTRVRAILRNRGLAAVLAYLSRKDSSVGDSPMRAAVRALGIRRPSLRAWAREHRVPLMVVGDLNTKRAVRAAERLKPQVAAYSGGGILRSPFLRACGHIVLNCHSGPLPAVRGMNALEWSLLLGHATGVTVHLIDEGIDTGPVLEWVEVQPVPGDTLDSLRERLVLIGAESLVRWVLRALKGELAPATSTGPRQRQCFVVAPALREVASRRLSERVARLV